MLTREQFELLLEQYEKDLISPQDRDLLFEAIATGEFDRLLEQRIEFKLRDDPQEGNNLPPLRSSEILQNIFTSEKQNAAILPSRPRKAKYFLLAVAAVLLIGFILFSYIIYNSRSSEIHPLIANDDDMRELTNTTQLSLPVKLEDGSTITLQPGAGIKYPMHFLSGKREVILEGDAFFEVTKNPDAPFLIYNRKIVTQVLGTSFNIKSNKLTHEIEVSVRTGKVEVYENVSTASNESNRKRNGVILLPNQKVTYDEDDGKFVASVADQPLPLSTSTGEKNNISVNNIFEEASLQIVLTYLEKNYGIEIITGNEALYNCLFTGELSQPDLYSRLDVVCQAVGATYEVKGTRILIKGNGCGNPIN